ncbi:MAG: phosphatase PAP2 family protein [Ilumatobacter sp.]|uniref:phosphatase PAP2 family protein n=1 Tax=Ilumatobacter sp. TaxID=1967498 RepID=UPI00329A7CFF
MSILEHDDPGSPTVGEKIDEAVTGEVPGQHQFGSGVERFDEIADALLERVRGNPIADRVFTTASHVGDFSLVWHSINIAIGISERKPKRVVAFAALIGVESLVVNQGVKRMFKRSRPTVAGETGLAVRRPSTSSFPSGHASAATFAAAMLAPRVGRPFSAAVVAAAVVVAISRAYVRIHHASDVVAGVVTGSLIVAATRRLVKRFGRGDLL